MDMDSYVDRNVFVNQNEKKSCKNGIWKFLNICSVLLALISFFTTSQGLKKYFFQDNEIFAYIGSIAIQGFLMGMNLRLAKYIGKKSPAAVWGAFGLYAVTVFFSAGFSYVYVSNSIYEKTRILDANTELSSTYEKEKGNLEILTDQALAGVSERLFEDLRAYADGEGVGKNAEKSSSLNVDIDWDKYEGLLADEPMMVSAIKELRSSDESGELGNMDDVKNVLNERKKTFELQIESVNDEVEKKRSEIVEKRLDKQSWIRQRYNYKADSAGHEACTEEIGKIDAEISILED